MTFSEEFDEISRREARSLAARSIHNDVQDWRGTKKPIASKRWLWELLQNARDSAGRRPFSFGISWDSSKLVVRHDAAPFSLKEIVALVEGDSSKRKRGETIGRFGKGFLVTHVISTTVDVRGILKHEQGPLFSFAFQLRRSGAQDDIRHNIDECARALDNASEVRDTDNYITEFVYHLSPDEEAQSYIEEGLRALEWHSPYLLAFVPQLTEITISRGDEGQRRFAVSTRQVADASAMKAEGELVTVRMPERERTVLTVTARGESAPQPRIAFAVGQDGQAEKVITPNRSRLCTIFQDFPLFGTDNVDIPIVINLPAVADVSSDRSEPDLTKEETHQFLADSLRRLPQLIDWTTARGISGAHLLAAMGVSEEIANIPEKKALWQQVLQPVVRHLFECSVVQPSRGARLAPRNVVFPAPFWLKSGENDKTLLGETRDLLDELGDKVPSAESAEDWNDIIARWRTVWPEIPARMKGLEDLFKELATAENVAKLRERRPSLRSDKVALQYVSRLFEVALRYCRRNRIDLPADLPGMAVIPNQFLALRRGEQVEIDGGVDDVLKQISEKLESPLRRRLVHPIVGGGPGSELVRKLCRERTLDLKSAVAELIEEVQSRATDPDTDSVEQIAAAAMTLLVWMSKNPSAVKDGLSAFPLVRADGRLECVAELHDLFVPPGRILSAAERQRLGVFPEAVRLSDQYVETCESLSVTFEQFGSFLERQRLSVRSLLFKKHVRPDSELLAALQVAGQEKAGHKVESVTVTAVPGFTRLLSATAGVSAAGQDVKAREVFNFVLGWLIAKDQSWRTPVPVPCSGRAGHACQGTVSLYPCEWLAKLKMTPWLPGAQGACETLNARSAEELVRALPPESFQSSIVREFLALHCGFDKLDLTIQAQSGGDPERERGIRDGWAAIVATVAPAEIEELISRRLECSRINSRNQRLGHIIEELIKEAFRREGFDVEPTGTGSDFRATLVEGTDPETEGDDVGRWEFTPRLGERSVQFLIEVKATQSDAVRMSWIQAKTASANTEGYILCVVDLASKAGIAEALLAGDQVDREQLAGCTNLKPGVGNDLVTAVLELEDGLEKAREGTPPGIQVEKTRDPRFRISRTIWDNGHNVSEWARTVRDRVTTP
ncbi:MAG: hypothetical protein AAB403_11950 [Planctomycetota bacterium]